MSSNYIDIPFYGDGHWQAPVNTPFDLPVNGNQPGDARIVLSTDQMYVWNGSAWLATTGTGVISLDGISGAVNLVAGSNITITPSGQDITISASGGAPGGSPTQLQYNNSGTFGGAPLSSVDITNKFIGIQQATPAAPLHISGVSGQTTPTPATLTGALTQVTSLTSPTSYSVTEIDSPPPPSITGVTLTYIDAPPSGGETTAFDATGTYVANGQTITYNLYTYVMVAGNRVANPLYASFSYTDTINDGITTFSVDITGLIIGGAGRGGGLILWKQDTLGYGPYFTDIGLPSGGLYTDDAADQNMDAYLLSPYAAIGSTWSNGVAEYINVNGGPVTGDYSFGGTADDNSGAYFYATTTWSAGTSFMVISLTGSNHFDVGTALTFTDYGQSGIPPFGTFYAIAFPYLPTSVSDGSLVNTNQNEGESGYTANGSSYYYNIYEYEYNVLNSQYYITSGYTVSLSDNNDSNNFAWDFNINPGTGQGRIVTVSVNGGPIVGAVLGNVSSFTDNNSWGALPTLYSLSSYVGTTRNFQAYGENSSPQYSSTYNQVTFTDTNPPKGYLIQHTVSGFGNAPSVKIIDLLTTDHPTPDPSSDPTTFIETYYTRDTNISVTPANIGYLATGQTLNYNAWSYNPSLSIYSPTYVSLAQVFPNNGNYYTVGLTIGSVAGDTYKVQKVGTGYATTATTSLTDDLNQAWSATSTVAPTSGPITAAITERLFQFPPTDPGTLDSRNTGPAPIAYNTFSYNNSGTYTRIGTYGVNSTSANFFIDTPSTHGLEIGPLGNPNTRFQQVQGAFNLNGSNYEWLIHGESVGYLLHAQASSSGDALIVGDQSVNTGFGSIFNVKAPSGKQAINIDTTNQNGGNLLNPALEVTDQFSGKAATISNNGRGMFGFGSSAGNSVLTVGNGGGADQLTLSAPAYSFPSGSLAGSINRWDNLSSPIVSSTTPIGSQLVFTDKNANQYPFAFMPGNSLGNVWHTDYTGSQLVADNAIHYNYSGSTLNYIQFNATTLFEQPIATVNGSNGSIGIGNGIVIAPNSGPGGSPGFSGHMSIGINNGSTQKVGFFGATPITQQANTVAIDTNLINQGLLASGTTAKFASALTLPYAAKTAAYTLTASDGTVDLSSGSFTFTLPTAVSATGVTYVLSNSGSGTLTIATTSSQTIRGAGAAAATTKTLAQYHSFKVQSDGANWLIIAST